MCLLNSHDLLSVQVSVGYSQEAYSHSFPFERLTGKTALLHLSCIASSQRCWGLEGTALGLQTCCWAQLLLAKVMGGGTLKSLYFFSPAGVNGTRWLPPAFRHLYKSASQQALRAGSCKALHDRIGAVVLTYSKMQCRSWKCRYGQKLAALGSQCWFMQPFKTHQTHSACRKHTAQMLAFFLISGRHFAPLLCAGSVSKWGK